MLRYLAATFSVLGLVFTVGCIGAPESQGDGNGGNGGGDNTAEAQAAACKPIVRIECPSDACIRCFWRADCSGYCECVACD